MEVEVLGLAGCGEDRKPGEGSHNLSRTGRAWGEERHSVAVLCAEVDPATSVLRRCVSPSVE